MQVKGLEDEIGGQSEIGASVLEAWAPEDRSSFRMVSLLDGKIAFSFWESRLQRQYQYSTHASWRIRGVAQFRVEELNREVLTGLGTVSQYYRYRGKDNSLVVPFLNEAFSLSVMIRQF